MGEVPHRGVARRLIYNSSADNSNCIRKNRDGNRCQRQKDPLPPRSLDDCQINVAKRQCAYEKSKPGTCLRHFQSALTMHDDVACGECLLTEQLQEDSAELGC